jgi:hypothetical protein
MVREGILEEDPWVGWKKGEPAPFISTQVMIHFTKARLNPI